MVDIEKFKTSPMGKALVELSEEMGDEHIPPITINAVGGFALMLHGKRDIDSVTDIDYIGTEFSQKFNKIADIPWDVTDSALQASCPRVGHSRRIGAAASVLTMGMVAIITPEKIVLECRMPYCSPKK